MSGPGRQRATRVGLLGLAMLVAATAALPAAAQTRGNVVELEATTNADTVRVGDAFQLDVVLKVHTNTPVEELRLPDLSQFTVVKSSRSQQQSISLGSGSRQITIEKRFTYLLTSQKPGVRVIGSGVAKIGTNYARSEPLRITVLPSDSPRSRSKDGRPEPYFLEVEFEKDDVVVGEQVNLVARVYAEDSIEARGFELPKLPKFWVEPLTTRQSRPSERVVGGQRYYVYDLAKVALFPLEPGTHGVGRLSVTVSARSGMWSRGRSYQLKSDPASVTVRPLPDQDRPVAFPAGNVGHWKLEARITPVQTEVGQAVTLSVLARGEGNPAQLELPSLPNAVDGVRVFPPTFDERKSVDEGVVYGIKQAEMLLQPTRAGRIRLPPLTLHFFDPRSGRFEESRTRPLTILVSPAGASSTAAGARAAIARSPRPVRTGLSPPGLGAAAVVRSALFWPGSAALVLGSLAVSTTLSRRRRSRLTEGARRAERRRRNRLGLLQAAEHANLRQVQAAVVTHAALCLGEAVRALSSDQLEAFLIDAGLARADAERLVRFQHDVEAVLYAPAGGGDQRRLISEATALLDVLEAAAPESDRDDGGEA